ASPPISLAVASARALSMSRHATVAPCSASMRADAAPMPDPAPVTAAILPSRRPLMAIPLLSVGCKFSPSDPGGRQGPLLRRRQVKAVECGHALGVHAAADDLVGD